VNLSVAMRKTALAAVHMENQDSSLVVGTDMQEYRDQAPDNYCTSKVVEVVDYNGVGKQAVETLEGAVAIAGVKSSVLGPQLPLRLRVP
jgi:hypothetical protein